MHVKIQSLGLSIKCVCVKKLSVLVYLLVYSTLMCARALVLHGIPVTLYVFVCMLLAQGRMAMPTGPYKLNQSIKSN